MADRAEFRVTADIGEFERKMAQVNRTIDKTQRNAGGGTAVGGVGAGGSGVGRFVGGLAGGALGGLFAGSMAALRSGFQESGKEIAANARLVMQMQRTGLMSQKKFVDQQSEALSSQSGAPVFEIKTLLAGMLAKGFSDIPKAMSVVKTALDVQADGSKTAEQYITMLAKANAGGAREITEFAREMGVTVTGLMTVQDVHNKVIEKYGGSAKTLEEAEGAIGRFGQALSNLAKDNADILRSATGGLFDEAAVALQDVQAGRMPATNRETVIPKRIDQLRSEILADFRKGLDAGGISMDEAKRRNAMVADATKSGMTFESLFNLNELIKDKFPQGDKGEVQGGSASLVKDKKRSGRIANIGISFTAAPSANVNYKMAGR